MNLPRVPLPARPLIAAMVLVLVTVLATALPAAAVVSPKFSGGKSGADSPDATTTPHGAHGATAGRGRVPHPVLLRAATPAADETLRGRAQEEADAAAREHAEQARPWAAEPHMGVRGLSGDPAVDAARVARLNAELATPIAPDRVRAGSLADDAVADDTLARLMPRRADAVQQQVWRFLRDPGSTLDHDHLRQALAPMQGDTLLVMGHVDGVDGAVVYKGANGRLRRLPVAMFHQAAHEAGVQLVVVGCKSARHTSMGFVDDLNGLDAARAMARAAQARPTSLFGLFSALSGPRMVMQFDAQTFVATHTVTVTAGHDGPVVSTLQWSGPSAQAAARASSAAEGSPSPRPAEPAALQSASQAAWAPSWLVSWVSAPAFQLLAGGLLLSWLAGVAALWIDGDRGSVLAWAVGIDALVHLLLPLFALTVLAEAVAGASGAWWAWGSALLAMGAALLLGLVASHEPGGKGRAMLAVMVLRLVVLAAPLLAVALLHTGWLVWPAPVMQVLLALYGLGRPLFEPWPMLGIGLLLFMVAGWLIQTFEAVQQRQAQRRERQGRVALWREQLAAVGVTGARAGAALAARLAFERRCTRPVAWNVRWDQARALGDEHAPDPWTGQPQRPWRLLAVPLLPPAEGTAPQAGFGLMRVGSAYWHPLPHAWVQRLRDGGLRAADLPELLARVEPRLIWSDFVPQDQLPAVGGLIGWGVVGAGVFGGLALWMDPGSGERLLFAGAGAALLLLLVLWPASMAVRRRLHLRWLQQVQPQAAPANAQQPTAAAAG